MADLDEDGILRRTLGDAGFERFREAEGQAIAHDFLAARGIDATRSPLRQRRQARRLLMLSLGVRNWAAVPRALYSMPCIDPDEMTIQAAASTLAAFAEGRRLGASPRGHLAHRDSPIPPPTETNPGPATSPRVDDLLLPSVVAPAPASPIDRAREMLRAGGPLTAALHDKLTIDELEALALEFDVRTLRWSDSDPLAPWNVKRRARGPERF